jgi:hypothetical protein
VVHGLEGVLNRIHAAEAGAVTEEPPVAGAHAQDEQNAVRMAPIGRANDLPSRRPSRGQKPLKLQRGKDIGMTTISQLGHKRGVQHLKPGSHYDGSHLPTHHPLERHEEVDGPWATGLVAAVTGEVIGRLIEAVLQIDDVRPRDGLGDGGVNGLARGDAGLILIGQ